MRERERERALRTFVESCRRLTRIGQYHFSSLSGDFAQVHLALREHMLLPGQESSAVVLPMDAVAHEGRERKKLGRGLILDQVKGFGKSTVSQGMAVLTHSTSQLGLSSQLKDSEKQKKRQSAILQVPTDADDREKSSARESEKGTVGGLEPSQSSERERDENERD